MRITEVQAIPVSVPMTAPLPSALGVHAHSDYGVVIIDTDAGHRGLGEISLIWHGDGHRLCATVRELIAPLLVGADPFALTRLVGAAREALSFGRHSLTAIAAVEMALLDLQGRSLGQPVHILLGGLARDRVDISMSLPLGPPEDALAAARAHVESGVRTVKVKAGGDERRDVETVRRLREEFGPELGIRVDLNMACATAKQALRLIGRLEAYDVLSVEQPLPPQDIDGLALLRARCTAPLMLDETVWSVDDAWRALQAGAADLINIYVAEAGGIVAAGRIAALCDAAGVGVAVGSMPELGIGTAAAGVLAFTAPRLDHASDVVGALYHADDVVGPPPRVVDGALLPPAGPGLGVELDEERLRAFRTDGGT
jgi:muconate cycloisomerase